MKSVFQSIKIIMLGLMYASVCCCDVYGADLSATQLDSQIKFKIEQFGLGQVEGAITSFNIQVKITEQAMHYIEAKLEVSSIKTGNKNRDRHLQKKGFFDSKRFPLISFKSSDVVDISDMTKTIPVNGYLRIKGINKPVTLYCQFEEDDNAVLRVRVKEFELLRHDFEVSHYKRLISNLVLIDMEVQLNYD